MQYTRNVSSIWIYQAWTGYYTQLQPAKKKKKKKKERERERERENSGVGGGGGDWNELLENNAPVRNLVSNLPQWDKHVYETSNEHVEGILSKCTVLKADLLHDH